MTVARSDMNRDVSFDFTYEELKPSWQLGKSIPSIVCFDFTYEELKRCTFLFFILLTILFWLYLWGIETRHYTAKCKLYSRFDFTYEELKHSWCGIGYPCRYKFWLYLWGIETNIICNFKYNSKRFWLYLWGIETRIVSD